MKNTGIIKKIRDKISKKHADELLKSKSICVLWVTAVRLVIMPLVFLAIAIVLDFRSADIKSLLSVFIATTAIFFCGAVFITKLPRPKIVETIKIFSII